MKERKWKNRKRKKDKRELSPLILIKLIAMRENEHLKMTSVKRGEKILSAFVFPFDHKK